MPTKKTATKRKKTSAQKQGALQRAKRPLEAARTQTNQFLARRPHRSFQRTRRRDYARSLELPSYVNFTSQVFATLRTYKKLFIPVVVVYAILTAGLVGIASQETYTALSETLRETSGDLFAGGWGELSEASLLLVTGVTGSFGSTLSEVQQVYAGFIGLLTWLTTVWLLRAALAGQKPRFRDGLYNAGAPIVPTLFIGLVLIVQLLPAAIAVIGLNAAAISGFLAGGGAVAMLFTVAALLLGTLSIYWITSTFIALVVVTLPGMYPMQALKTAGDLVIGRRLRILLRWAWLGLIVCVLWVLVMVPVIIFDTWLKGLWPAVSWLPIVPIGLLIMSSFSVVFSASYIYLLYRKVVEDDAKPA